MNVRARSLALGLCALLVIVSSSRSDDAPKSSRHVLEGAWTQKSLKMGDENQSLPEGMTIVKFVADGRFVWTISQDGKLLASAGGRYTIDGGHYSEKIEYAHGEGNEHLLGKTYKFTWKLDGDTWHHVFEKTEGDGEAIAVDQLWTRSK